MKHVYFDHRFGFYVEKYAISSPNRKLTVEHADLPFTSWYPELPIFRIVFSKSELKKTAAVTYHVLNSGYWW